MNTEPSQPPEGISIRCPYLNIEVTTHPGAGASYNTSPQGGVPEICIGLDYETFDGVIECLLHEAQELFMTIKSLRYDPSMGTTSSDRFTFILSHFQFADMCNFTSVVVVDSWDFLQTKWKSFKDSVNFSNENVDSN